MFFGQSQRRGGLGSCRGIFIKTHRTSRERDAKSSRRGARRRHGRADASERGADAELLANGPEPGRSDLNPFAAATEVPERSLIAAASALGARTRKGQGWLRG